MQEELALLDSVCSKNVMGTYERPCGRWAATANALGAHLGETLVRIYEGSKLPMIESTFGDIYDFEVRSTSIGQFRGFDW